MDLQPGSKLGPYEIDSLIGKGGMGWVYLATDSRLDRKVAVKLLTTDLTGDAERVRRFEQEARAASALNHPNIVTIHDIGQSDAGRFIVMERVEGRTLRAMIDEPVAPDALARIGAQIARSLTVAHAAGIVHRDIKPANVMLRDDGYVKVLDFGLVRLTGTKLREGSDSDTASLPLAQPLDPDARADAATAPGTLIGTTAYMSPEQARGESVGSATDLFSLGILLYEVATGKHPFAADSPIGTLHGILSTTPISPSRMNPELSGSWEALILQMLEKDARLRPTAAEAESILNSLAQSERDDTAVKKTVGRKSHTVGRDAERATLHASFRSAVNGQGSLVCVSGEPGIGKTTLLEEFLGELEEGDQPCHIARGRCSERLAGTEAYLPIFEALDSLLHHGQGESVASAMKAVAPTWYVLLMPVSTDGSSAERMLAETNAASQERMKRELAVFLAEVTRRKPVVLFLDDLHWTDVATVEVLAYLATKFDSMRVLIVATFRRSDLLLAEHPFLRVKLDLQGRGLCREIAVELLRAEDIERYLALEFPENQFPAELPALIFAKTEGNPLFMVDLVRYLRDREVIAETDGQWQLARAVPEIELDLPESVRSMVQRKIDLLDAEDRRLLVVASVQGAQFDSAIVAQAAALDAADVEEQLETLARVHVLVRRTGEHELPDTTLTVGYSFVHALYQNALYGSLAPTRRATLAGAVANALVNLHGDESEAVASQLALLFETARKFEQAADYFIVAAQNACKVHANDEAVELLHRAIANAEKLKGKARYRRVLTALLHSAQAHMTVSHFEQANADFEKAEAVARDAGDVEAEIGALCGSGMVLFAMKRLSEVRAKGERALEIANRVQSTVGIATAQLVLGHERLCIGDIVQAEEYYDLAMPVLSESGLSQQAMEVFTFRGYLHAWKLEYDDAHRVAKLAMTRARDVQGGYHVLQVNFLRGMVLGNEGRLSEALSMLHDGLNLAELNDDRYWLPRIPNTIGWIHRELEDLETALKIEGDNVQMALEMDAQEAEANARTNLVRDHLLLGELDRAREQLEEVERIMQQDTWFRWRYQIRMRTERASYWIAMGDLTRATAVANEVLQNADVSAHRKHAAWAHKLVGDCASLEDRVDDAQRCYQSALQVLGNHRCPTIEWRILTAAGKLAKQTGDDDAAAEFRGRARAVVDSLAESVDDAKLRKIFLSSRAVREL